MKKIKLFPSQHLELKISVTDEMIRDYQECAECAKKESGKDCSTCSWDDIRIEETALCCLLDLEKVLKGEGEDKDEETNEKRI